VATAMVGQCLLQMSLQDALLQGHAMPSAGAG
jgi:hypothetical protein